MIGWLQLQNCPVGGADCGGEPCLRGSRGAFGHAWEGVVVREQEACDAGLGGDGADLGTGGVAALGVDRLPRFVQQRGHARRAADGLRVELGVGAVGETVTHPEPAEGKLGRVCSHATTS